MSTTSIYLTFVNNCEAAFNFYKTVFGTEFIGETSRYADMPQGNSTPTINENSKNLILNVQLPILGGVKLMGSDSPAEMGFNIIKGTNVTIVLEPDTKEETDKLYAMLAEGGKATMPIANTFWDAYYGECSDKFGIQWSFNCENKK